MSTKTHFQVFDRKERHAVQGCEAMMFVDNAQYVCQRLNRRSRAKVPRYVIVRVDPDNLPLYGAELLPEDRVNEFRSGG